MSYAEVTGLTSFAFAGGSVFAADKDVAVRFAEKYGMIGRQATHDARELQQDYIAAMDWQRMYGDAAVKQAAAEAVDEYVKLDGLEEDAALMARHAANALEAVKTIRDRAAAARRRGLREDDVSEIARAREFLSSSLSMCDLCLTEVDRRIAAVKR